MYMSRIGTSPESAIVRELHGARILLTGLSATCGVDVARAFADLRARLIVHTTDLSPEVTELIALLSQNATEIRLYTDPIHIADAAVRFAQIAAQAFGGLDAVINLTTVSREEIAAVASQSSIENLIYAKLTPLAHLTGVTANRMRLVASEGLILNVLSMPHPQTAREMAIASVARTALAAMTKTEAHAWAGQGVRINAIGPRVMTAAADRISACLSNEPDIAALAIYLASKRGRSLSGHIFDADGAAFDG